MKRLGIVSYNIHANFTNYGSALQSWALCRAIASFGFLPVLVDYCPDVLADANPLDPYKKVWDKDDKMKKMIELSMPAIKANYVKFERFYTEQFNRSKPYTKSNFNDSICEVDSYVCGSDTIFSPDEFDLDDGYFANYECMRGNSVSYAASFGDPHFSNQQYGRLAELVTNFKALGIRESLMIDSLKKMTSSQVKRVIDPTLLLQERDYEKITNGNRLVKEKYLLYYSRRNNSAMEKYAEEVAKQNGWKIVDISLQATNESKGHVMFYQAGVEDFLSLVKHAEFVVTNSYHGMIFSVQFKKEFVIFSRALCDTKIKELLQILGITDRLLVHGDEGFNEINWGDVYSKISSERKASMKYLREALLLL